MGDSIALLCCFFVMQHGSSQYEHCNSSYVKGIQLEQCYCGPHSVFFLLGLSAHTDRWRDLGR
nr:hypothetical protein Iba_chr12cCG0870 [Ipomoea batatas]